MQPEIETVVALYKRYSREDETELLEAHLIAAGVPYEPGAVRKSAGDNATTRAARLTTDILAVDLMKGRPGLSLAEARVEILSRLPDLYNYSQPGTVVRREPIEKRDDQPLPAEPPGSVRALAMSRIEAASAEILKAADASGHPITREAGMAKFLGSDRGRALYELYSAVGSQLSPEEFRKIHPARVEIPADPGNLIRKYL